MKTPFHIHLITDTHSGLSSNVDLGVWSLKLICCKPFDIKMQRDKNIICVLNSATFDINNKVVLVSPSLLVTIRLSMFITAKQKIKGTANPLIQRPCFSIWRTRIRGKAHDQIHMNTINPN
jgi:hypothetical protein